MRHETTSDEQPATSRQSLVAGRWSLVSDGIDSVKAIKSRSEFAAVGVDETST